MWVADWEADELRPLATQCWCGVGHNLSNGEIVRFYNGRRINKGDLYLEDVEKVLKGQVLIMHNGIEFDRWLLKKTLGFNIPIPNIIDTLILSRMLRPDLKVPPGWKGKPAPHSVEAYGMRYGIPKPEYEDWSKFTPDMLFRCEKDVDIQTNIYKDLTEEAIKLNV